MRRAAAGRFSGRRRPPRSRKPATKATRGSAGPPGAFSTASMRTSSPRLAQKPWIRVGNRQVLAPEAAPPTVSALTMLAHMPFFRSEYHEHIERLYTFLTQPLPRQESAQLVGGTITLQPHFVLGDLLPHRNAVEADVPAALMWLELMARLGFLRRNENWTKMLDRFADDCDRTGVWHPHKGMAMPRSSSPFVWPMFPLEHSTAGRGALGRRDPPHRHHRARRRAADRSGLTARARSIKRDKGLPFVNG